MKPKYCVFAFSFIYVMSSFGAGCVSKKATVSRTDGAEEALERKIPTEIAKSYEVSDHPRAQGAPSVLATAATAGEVSKAVSKKEKVSKKKKKAEVEQAKVEEFTIPSRRPDADPFRVGEKVTFDVTWLKTTAGEMSLELKPFKYIEGRKVYQLRGEARTTSLFAKIYRAEDYCESYVDYDGWMPYRFVLHGDESKHIRDTLELFDHAHSKQYVYMRDDRLSGGIHEDKGYRELTPFSQDGLSCLFFLRTFPLELGKTITIPMTTSGSQAEVKITPEKREEVRTKMGPMRAIKSKVDYYVKGQKQTGDAFFWVTDDDRRFIIKFEAKVRIGWISGIAKQIDLGGSEH